LSAVSFFTLADNGDVYETLGIAGYFPGELQRT